MGDRWVLELTIKIVISSFHAKGLGREILSPQFSLLFNMVEDVFSKMLSRAARQGLISGLLTRFKPEGIISLQYPDDTLLFLENNLNSSRNIKWLLSVYEQLSGMRINFSKCDLVPINIP
jgi:hypothetical protein